MAEPTDKPTHDTAVAELCRLLINSVVLDAEKGYGDTPRDRLVNHVKTRSDERMMEALDAFSGYLSARAAERQAAAMETVAKAISTQAMAEKVDTDAAAMVDLRESKREYLATTYSLTTEMLSLLWAVRGMLMDASIKSLSKPNRFDPYVRLSTEELAWSLRMAPAEFIAALPYNPADRIDYGVLADFDILHYGGSEDEPDDWMFGG